MRCLSFKTIKNAASTFCSGTSDLNYRLSRNIILGVNRDLPRANSPVESHQADFFAKSDSQSTNVERFGSFVGFNSSQKEKDVLTKRP